MFGYIRPYQSELLVREHEQYKAVYCELCRRMGKSYGWLSRFSLSYDCAFYAMLALAVSGAKVQARRGRCVFNPLKKCSYIGADGEEYEKAAALSVLLTDQKLRDDREDEGFWRSLGCRLLLPFVSRKAKRAAARYPFLAEAAQAVTKGQREAETTQAGLDACAEPTARLLASLFQELAGCDRAQGAALERFGYFLGRWVYLMDASDDLAQDLKKGKFNPFIRRLGLEGKTELTPEERQKAEAACNQELNAAVAQMLLALNLIELANFGPIIENVVKKGLPEIQREILFLHVREKKKEEGRHHEHNGSV